MDIVKSEFFSFEEYRKIVDKYVNQDYRELNFQNRVVLQLIDKVLANTSDLSIVDVHVQYKNRESELHTRKYYAGDHTPDLLIVKDWNYENIQKAKSDYVALVEVKSPVLDPISREVSHTNEEIEEYMKICDRVILTDCYTWKFYFKGKETKVVILHDENDWRMQKIDNPKFVQEELGFPPDRMEPVDWDKLIEYLKTFLIV